MKKPKSKEVNPWVVDWWLEYIDGDILKREDMIKALPIRLEYERVICDEDLDEEIKERISILHYLSLFDDCVDACYYKFKEK
jgi:hypothetical protein